jgi:NAD(P)-dependent dehydrogenase (short-subunit alcohol dehydrogenase family)
VDAHDVESAEGSRNTASPEEQPEPDSRPMTSAGIGRPLAGTRVLITGASSGVGLAAARQFAAEGAAVAMLARRGDVLSEISEELGSGARGFAVDVADPVAVASAVEEAASALGGLDIAINSAAVVDPLSLDELDAAAWRRVIDVNLSGTFYVARECALRMRAAGGGVIINIGSDLASMGVANFVHYCAAKAGVVGMTRGMAAELAPTVRVNAVCPGPIDTPMMEAQLQLTDDPAGAREASMGSVPLRRFASPEEVAAAVRFLAVDAGFATGSVLALDGGTTAV